jgi:hypothetical protein
MQKKKLFLFFLSVTVLIILGGCTTATPATPIPTSIPTSIPSAQLFTSTAIPTSNPSPLPPSPTAITTSTTSLMSTTPLPVEFSDCFACHPVELAAWKNGAHANTQNDVAKELADARSGQTPNEVISGAAPEDCIACHAPKAVTISGGSSDAAVLNHFFTTIDGKFTADTKVADAANWPQINCGTCHQVSDNHKTAKLEFGVFNSQTAQYVVLGDSSKVCGQCHGSLLFSNTDHQIYNAWLISKHSATQADVATELGASRSGQTPNEVINGQDSENCIACHAPTAVLANGGMTQAAALNYFFTSSVGKFSPNTAVAHASEWPNVSCTTCHDPHNPRTPAYFNSATKQYQPMASTSELCGQCHGNLRFPNTDHLSYNIIAGTGGMGVPDQVMMPKATCTDCHMYNSGVDGSNSAHLGGHSWAITVNEPDGGTTTSCTHCHADLNTANSEAKIKQLKSEFQVLDDSTKSIVDKATQAMTGNTTPELQDKLNEAQFNLSYAESDESGGFHNHTYLMALLNDSTQRAQEILTALGK